MIDTLTRYYNFNTKCNFKHNEKKEGIEVYFTSVPTKEERDKLKESNWHWNHKKECWYVKEKLLRDMNILSEEVEEKPKAKAKTKKVEKTEETTELNKTQLATIKRILKNKNRPVLECYTPMLSFGDSKHSYGVNNPHFKVAICDSYRLAILNQEKLDGYKVAFTKDCKFEKDYLKKFKVEKENSTYPNLENVIPHSDPEDTFIVDRQEVLDNAKENKGKKNKDNRIMKYTTEEKQETINIDSEYLKDMIQLLNIKEDKIVMNFFGEFKPTTYENENGYYLALPIKTY